MHYDSTGKTIHVGDRVKWRGQIYTIKAFGEKHPVMDVPLVEFEEPLHLQGEHPHEFSIDLVTQVI